MIQLEILNKHLDFSTDDIDREDIIKAMNDYAKIYHKQQVKNLNLASVSCSLPSNDEIIKHHNSIKTINGNTLKHTLSKMHRLGYYRGAIWMRELISNDS